MRSQIVEKLSELLSDGFVVSEPNVTYIMVETRKILDHAYNKKTDYTLLRFYCDWVVHTDKSQNLQHIAPLVQQVYDDVKDQIEQGPHFMPPDPAIVGFMYMEGLRKEMEDLFIKEALPLDMFDKSRWTDFVSALVQVLTNQPILNPTPDVTRLELVPANPGCICGILEFAKSLTEPDGQTWGHYKFMNAF